MTADTPERPAQIAVIIVNYGTADLTIKAVESVLEKAAPTRSFEVHVVDNASPNGDGPRLQDAHKARGWPKTVTIWAEPENHGFGRGNNVVLTALAKRQVPPEYVLLLNPDAQLDNDALTLLSAVLDANPKAAAAGAGISLPNGAPVTAAFRFPGVISELTQTIRLGVLDKILARFRVPLAPEHPESVVDWVSGAGVMFRFAALKDAGFFDPFFFLYFEETDLQRRLGRAGWQTHYVPSARIEHVEGAATGQFQDTERQRRLPPYMYHSRWYYHARARGRLGALVLAILIIPAGALNVLHRRLRGRAPNLPEAFFRDHLRHGIGILLSPGFGR